MGNSDTINDEYLEQARAGRPQALGELLQRNREKLLRIIKFRMDPRLRGRLDADDIVQEAFIEATSRFTDYCENQEMPFFLWLRYITVQKLFQMHRKHLGTKSRDAGREVSIYSGPSPQATSAVLAAHLLGKHTSPSVAAMRAETTMSVERALNSMSEMDREILALRRFEKLQNHEVAKLLDISKTAASNRYIRALERLQKEVEGNKAGESRI
ncbi:MAG: sigma-70 family RNA polymerase sigma factor [Planctomycetota bacterium]